MTFKICLSKNSGSSYKRNLTNAQSEKLQLTSNAPFYHCL